MKPIDDTPLPESESEVMVEVDFADLLNQVAGLMFEIERLQLRIANLEKELALLTEERVIVRAPECEEDPEWY